MCCRRRKLSSFPCRLSTLPWRVSELISTLERVRANINPDLTIEGVLLTMYDDRTNLAQQVTETLRELLSRSTLSNGDSAQCAFSRGA